MHGRVSVTGYGHGAKIAAGAATRADVMGVVFDKDASPLDLVSQVTGKALGYHSHHKPRRQRQHLLA